MAKIEDFRMTAVVLAAVLAAILLVMVTRPAEATFPGTNGKIIFERQTTDILALNPDGTTPRLGEGSKPAVSPDGSRIAYVLSRNIWLMNADGTGIRQLTTDSKFNDDPAWSPDGSRIAFSAGSPGAFDDADIFVMNADGSGKINLTNTQSNLSESDPAWSPDGSRIAYTRSFCDPNGGGAQCVFVMNADGTNPQNLTPETILSQCPNQPGYFHKGASEDPSWSPNGARIAFEGTVICPNGSGTDIWVMNANGSGKINLTNDNSTGDRQPVFSPDGNELAFTSDRGNSSSVQELYKITLSTGTISGKLTTGGAFSPDWQPDLPACDISGTPGDDTALTGTSADETICGLGGNDVINGGGGNDVLLGGDGNDVLAGAAGRSTLNGGAGRDTASFAASATPVKASLVTGFAQRVNTNPLEGVALVGVENLTGSALADQLSGSAVANTIVGGKGADTLSGLGGGDSLNSRDGAKNDKVAGGPGRDRCVTDTHEVSITSCP
jgi:Tol biopolymer transport system component